MANPSLARRATVLALLAVAVAGCSTHATRLREARERFYSGDLNNANSLLERAGSSLNRDEDCLLLDRAIVQLVGGQPQESEQALRQVRDRFDYLEQQDLAENTLAMFTDDKRRAYAGEDYEKVLVRVFLAFSSLMNDGQDAIAYGLQIEQKQQEIIDRGFQGASENPKLAYQQLAIGPYLDGVLSEATHAEYGDAARSFAKVASWQPGFRPAVQDLARVQNAAHSRPGHGVAYVFTLVGRGPYKEESVEEPTSGALLIADRILSAVGKYQLPPTIAPIKVPRVVVPHNEINTVGVRVEGKSVGFTQTITDVGDLAVSQHEAVLPHLVARAVVRRVIKKSVAYGVQDGLNVDNQWVSLGILAAGVAWEFTESADTRCWGLLPEKIQVLRVELPVGAHTLSLIPSGGAIPIGAAHSCTVPIQDGRNTYVLACFPGRQLVGEIGVSK